MTEPQGPTSRRRPGRAWSVVGIVSGALAFVLIPILFGPLGIVLGIVGYRKGDRRLGRVAIIVSALGLILGIVLTISALTLLQTQGP